MSLNPNRGSLLMLVLLLVFAIPFSHFYNGKESGLILVQFLTICSICLEATITWQPRIYDSTPVWAILVPVSTILVYLNHGLAETFLYVISVLLLTLAAIKFSAKRKRRIQPSDALHIEK